MTWTDQWMVILAWRLGWLVKLIGFLTWNVPGQRKGILTILLIMGLHIVTFNANGLLDRKKRQEVFSLSKAKNVDILILQETHVFCRQEALKFEQDWGSKGYWSYSISNKQCGVGILFNTKLQYKVGSFQYDAVGRYIVLNITVGDQQFCIINVYAPNDIKDRKAFFNSLDHHLAGQKQFIFTGDFNCVENLSLDKIGGDPQSGDKGAEILKNICSTFDLIDVFRSKYPKKQEFTYIYSTPIFLNVVISLGLLYYFVQVKHQIMSGLDLTDFMYPESWFLLLKTKLQHQILILTMPWCHCLLKLLMQTAFHMVQAIGSVMSKCWRIQTL